MLHRLNRWLLFVLGKGFLFLVLGFVPTLAVAQEAETSGPETASPASPAEAEEKPAEPTAAEPSKEEFAAARPAEPSKEALAAARDLFKQGLAAEKENAWQEALTAFEKVSRVKMTSQVRYHIGLCHEKLGHFVDALNAFELAAQEAKAAGVKTVAEQAPLHAEAVRERIGYLTITVTGTIRTSRIFIDERPVDLALLGARLPVDPGKHALLVKRGDELVEERAFELAEKEEQSIELFIDDPEPVAEPVTGPTGPAGPRPDEDNPRVPAYITAGAGLAVLGGAGVFFALRQATLYNLDCETIDPSPLGPTATGCHPDSQATADLAQTYTHVTNVFAAVGGAAVATGVVLFFVLDGDEDPEQPEQPATTARSIQIAPAPGGVQIMGRF